jgi:hypothetical protein
MVADRLNANRERHRRALRASNEAEGVHATSWEPARYEREGRRLREDREFMVQRGSK